MFILNKKYKNLVLVLQDRAKRRPHQSAYLFLNDDQQEPLSITYGELDKRARAIAVYLQSKDLFAQRVLLLYPMGLDFICAFMGCLYAGAIAVPVIYSNDDNFKKSLPILNAIADDAEIHCILTAQNHLTLNNKPILILDTRDLNDELSIMYQLPLIQDDTIAYLQYTSGSTSAPKGTIIRHGSLTHSLVENAKAWNYKKSSISLTWAPHSHVYGLVCGQLTPLYHGSLAILMPVERFIRRPASWLEAIAKYRVTHSGCPNFGYDLCVREINSIELIGLNLQSWKVAINGGEIVRQQTLDDFSKKLSAYGFKLKYFCPAYGMSEVTGTVAVNRNKKKPIALSLNAEALKNNEVITAREETTQQIFVSSGRLLNGLQITVVDPDTRVPVNKNKIGELWITGKSLASGYWQRLEETKSAFYATLTNSKKCYFRTGDLGFVKNNEIYLTGRLKELIVIYGKKYYPQDLEATVKNALSQFNLDKPCACFTLSNNKNEELVFIQEIKDDISNSSQNEIIKSIRAAISEHHGIDLHGVILIKPGAIPKTTSGKLQRSLCKTLFIEEKLEIVRKHFKTNQTIEEPHPHPDNEIKVTTEIDLQQFEKDFINLVASILNVDANEIDLSDSVNEYGFDSITITNLMVLINREYQVNLTPANLFEYTTLDGLYNYLISQKFTNVVRIEPAKTNEFIAIPTNDNDIAIIGMNGLFPGAADLDTFWNNLISGKEVITEIPQDRWDWKACYGDPLLENDKTKDIWGGFIDGVGEFDANFFNISPREAELIDPQQRLFLQTTYKTIEDAGYSTKTLANFKTGVFVGMFTYDYIELLQKKGITDVYMMTGITSTILANRVSYTLDLHGPSTTVDTACSSSFVAIHQAVQAINNGDCDIALAGAVNTIFTPHLHASKAGILSEDGKCKTFDKAANGYVRGEGIVAILLKQLNKAQADGDHIYAVIKGTAVNHGGQVSSITVPNPNAQADVIISACQRAQVPIDTISYIETHGTGTSIGDPIEINGLKNAFHTLSAEQTSKPLNNNYCGLGAIKTNIGHLEAAAGIAGLVKTVLSMQQGQIPGNLNFTELNPYIDLDKTPFYLVNKTQPWDRLKTAAGAEIPRRAGISSFGFGGTNAHIIVEEYRDHLNENPINSNESTSYLITLSAKTDGALKQRINDLSEWLMKKTDPPDLAAISYTLNLGRNHFDKRCALIVKSITELQETLIRIQQNQFPENYIVNDGLAQTNNRLSSSKEFSLARLYVTGSNIEWESLKLPKRRVSLPGYPFAKDYYWVPNLNQPVNSTSIKVELTEPNFRQEKLEIIKQDLVQLVAQLLKKETYAINLTASFSEQGLESIVQKELAAQLANRYGIELAPIVFFTHTNITALSKYLLEAFPIVFSSFRYETQKINYIKPIKSTFNHEPIAIIGMQGYFPQSKDLTEFWAHLLASHDLVTEIPIERWDWREYYGDAKQNPTKTNSKWGGFIDGADTFDAAFFNISAREANLMDPQHRLFLEIVWKTIEDAGYDPFSLSAQEVGIFAGIEFQEYQTLIQKQNKIFHGHISTGNSHALLTNRVSYFLNLNGPSESIDTACSSALVAIHRAVNALHNGECNIAIAGGVSLILDPQTFVVTSQLGALSPDGRCKTFDKTANGYVKGEGVATIMLKPLNMALNDGDHIYGVIKGSAVNHGGKAQSLTAPNTTAQSELLVKAYKQTNIDINTVSYIETHGTGTELGDPIEIEGIKQAFNILVSQQGTPSKQKAFCGLGTVKTNIGHLEPASGIAGVIKVLLAMQHETIPGNLHLKELNPYIDLSNSPFYIVEKTRGWPRLKDGAGTEIPRRAGVSSFGFGGTNAHMVIEEYPQIKNSSTSALLKPYYLITLSAKQEASLIQKFKDLHVWLKMNLVTTNLADLSFTLNAGRSHFNTRCAIVVTSLEDLLQTLELLMENQLPNNCLRNTTSTNNCNGPLFNEIYKSTIDAIKNYEALPPEIYRDKLLLLADLYINNFQIDWGILHAGERKLRLAGLPSYPFIKQRYWFDADIQTAKSEITTTNPIVISQNATQPIDLSNLTINYLQQIFAEKLQLQSHQISADATYEEYGIDSLIGLEITERLEKDFGSLSKTLLYERSKIADLALFFQQSHKPTLLKLVGNQNNDLGEPREELNANCSVSQETFTPSQPDKSAKTNESNDIAIIGLSGTYPLAKDIDELWTNLVQGRDCISEVPIERWNYKDYPVLLGEETKYFKYGGFIPDIDKFDPLLFKISPADAATIDPQERLFLQSVWTTFEDAGYTRESLQRLTNGKVGVFAGVTYNFYPLFIADEWAKGNRIPLDIQMFSIANRVSYFFNLNGPSYPVDTACSSSLAAIHLACESILRGECIMAIAGGVNLSLHPCKYHMLGSLSFMSDQGRCSSFAAGGQGYVPSEGVGTVLLKPLSLAIKDNDRIYGVIKSSTMNHGGKTSGYTIPNPNAQAAVIKAALEKANIDPRSISYIEAHGTGTALGDPIEIRGLQEAFEHYTKDKQFCAIGSVKSNIGHLESAAGISQLTKVLLQMQHKKLVASIHAEELNPFIDFKQSPFFVQRELSDWSPIPGFPRRAGVSSFGAGGTNIHIIIEEYIADVRNNNDAQSKQIPFILLISAQNADRLQDYVQQIYAFLLSEGKKQNTEDDLKNWLSNICYTSQVGRENMPTRLAILATTYNDLIDKLNSYLTNPANAINQVWVSSPVQNNKAALQPQHNLAEFIEQAEYEKITPLWTNGAKVNWELLYTPYKPKRVFLTTYPFAKRRCWVPSSTAQNQQQQAIDKSPTPPVIQHEEKKQDTNYEIPNDINDWLYCTRWEQKSTDNTSISNIETERWLIFSDKELGGLLQDTPGKSSCIYCFAGEKFEQLKENVFYINPSSSSDYHQLFASIFTIYNKDLKGIIYLANFAEDRQQMIEQTDLYSNNQQAENSLQLFSLLQGLIKQNWQNKLKFCLVTRSSQPVVENDPIQIWQHHLWSLMRIFSVEHADYKILLLDLDSKKRLREEASAITQELLNLEPGENYLAFREKSRYVIRLASHLEETTHIKTTSWRAPETALITGGLGALGAEVAQWLVKQGTKFLLLTGSTPLPERSEWSKTHETSLQEKLTNMISLEKLGAQVKYATVDVCDKIKMQSIIEQTEQSWGKSIKGLFHLAGITTDSIPIAKMTKELLQKVLSVKVQGTLVLHEIFKKADLDCFVLFSSIAAMPYFGMSGLSAYAMANEFLNGFAAYRRQLGLPATSINWTAWADKGMSFRYNHSAFLDAVGMSTIAIPKGMEILEFLLNNKHSTTVTVFKMLWQKFFKVNSDTRKLPLFANFAAQHTINNQAAQLNIDLDPEQITTNVASALAEILGLEITEMDTNSTYQDYGLDSINGINFVSRLSDFYPDIVSPMDLFRYTTINQLVGFIIQSCQPTTPALTQKSAANNGDILSTLSEDEFLEKMTHLNDEQINKLLEEELMQVDELSR